MPSPPPHPPLSSTLTAAQFQDRHFPAHGEFSLCWHGRVLLIDVRGPFNVELVRASLTALQRIASEAPPGGCVEVVNWGDSMLMPEEALALFDRAMLGFQQTGMAARHTLLVTSAQLEGRWLMLPRLLAIWQRDRPVELFEQLDAALARAQQLAAALEKTLAG